ncbi:hypothetical protein [Chondromyces crocatus]|uniref:Uncharacterized protein n=1 Tax=Chondromyces crocatus TaxID=52 RepID=A0A0K1EHJ4_CHOCO|nr:hypothetical protein [Chondromyces crocatus]AKT40142.1 uncharacterized protein CMC5_042950 [Chondromyces crocatus]
MDEGTLPRILDENDLVLEDAETTMPLLEVRIEALLTACLQAASLPHGERLAIAEELVTLFSRADQVMQQVYQILQTTAAATCVDDTVTRLIGEIDEVRTTFALCKAQFDSAIFGDRGPFS